MNSALSTERETTRRDGARQGQRPRRSRRWTFCERMRGQYWRVARRRRVLWNIFLIFRDDLTIVPMQCQEAARHLVALRRAAQHAQAFYSGLSPQRMRQVQPWGTIAKLADLDSQVTEILLCVVAMYEAMKQDQIYVRIQMHVLIRDLFPPLLTCFEDVTSQLRALVEKTQECRERGRLGGGHL